MVILKLLKLLYLDVIGKVFFCVFLVVLVVYNGLVVISKLGDKDNRGPRERFCRPRYHLAYNCTIFLCSLDVRNIDDQCRGPSIKEKDQPAE